MKKRAPFIVALILMFFSISNIHAVGIEFVSSFGGKIRDSVTYRDRVYLAQRDSIRIIDIHDKSKIREIGTYRQEGYEIDELVIKWPVLFVVTHRTGSVWSGVEAVDVSDPRHPQEIEVDHFPGSKSGLDLEIDGNSLKVKMDVLRVYDVSNPLSPIETNEKVLPGIDSSKKDGSTSTTTMKSVSHFPLPPEIVYSGSVQNVMATGKLVYLDDGNSNIKSIDVTDPGKPKYVGVTKDSEKIWALMKANVRAQSKSFRLNNRYAISAVHKYLVGDSICIHDLSNPASPKLICTLMPINYAENERFEGFLLTHSLLFVIISFHNTGMKSYALSLYDLTKINEPKFLGSYPKTLNSDEKYDEIYRGFADFPNAITVSGDLIFVAEQEYGLIILRLDKGKNE